MEKKEIIEKAHEQFIKHGYKTVTMDDIASILGISKKTLYESFSSKGKLIQAVLEHKFEEVSQIISEIQALKLNPVEEFIHTRLRISDRFENEQQHSSIYQLRKYYLKTFEKVFNQQREVLRQKIKKTLRKGVEQELFRENLDTEMLSNLFMVTQNATKNDDFLMKGNEENKLYCELNFEVFIRGILTPSGLSIYLETYKSLEK